MHEPGERELRVYLPASDAEWLDRLQAQSGFRTMAELVASLVHHVVADDRAAEHAKPARTRRAA